MSDNFYLPPGSLAEGRVSLDGGQAHHIARVLRYGPGQTFDAFDGEGGRYLVRIESAAEGEVTGTVEKTYTDNNEPAIKVVLACALIKKDRFDWMVEKATETGVAAIVPLVTERTVVKVNPDKEGKRLERWHKIALEAAQQSRRSRIPEIMPVTRFADYTAQCAGIPSFIPCMPETESGIGAAAAGNGQPEQINILIGPEGGFTENEIDSAREQGIRPVTLGKRRLRTETACLAALWSILDTFSDF